MKETKHNVVDGEGSGVYLSYLHAVVIFRLLVRRSNIGHRFVSTSRRFRRCISRNFVLSYVVIVIPARSSSKPFHGRWYGFYAVREQPVRRCGPTKFYYGSILFEEMEKMLRDSRKTHETVIEPVRELGRIPWLQSIQPLIASQSSKYNVDSLESIDCLQRRLVRIEQTIRMIQSSVRV